MEKSHQSGRNYKKNQMKILKLKFTIPKILEVNDEIQRRLKTAEEKIGRLEDRPIEGTQSKEQA